VVALIELAALPIAMPRTRPLAVLVITRAAVGARRQPADLPP
jgi:hypothetical protein